MALAALVMICIRFVQLKFDNPVLDRPFLKLLYEFSHLTVLLAMS